VTLNTGLIGQPTPGGQNVAPVGPTVETGAIAIADNTTGLQAGIRYGSMFASTPEPGDGAQLAEAVATDREPAANDQASRLAASGTERRLDPEAQSARADARALTQAEWLARLGSRIRGWLAPWPATKEVQPPTAPLVAQIMAGNHAATRLLGRGPSDGNKRFISSAHADIGAVASLIVVGAVGYRLRKPLLKWWRRRERPALETRVTAKRFGQGPHTVLTRTRATARALRRH
jgi:hypothetical protein